MQILSQLLDFLTPYGPHSYVVMFGILLACGFGFPMPEDIVLITGGILASRGITDFWVTVLVCMAGVLVGDGTIFMLGRRFGPSIKALWPFKKLLSEKMDHRVRSIFTKYGDKVIFMARFMPGLRTPLFLTAGIYHVPVWKFVALDGVAALVSVPLWVYVGFLFGENLDELEMRIRQFQTGIYVGLVALVVLFVAIALVKKKAMKTLDLQ